MRGNAEAQKKLGDCYSHGTGVTKDLEQAFECYREAAEQGLAQAQYNIGLCYKNGNGVEKNPEMTAMWYRKAALHTSSYTPKPES